MNEHGKLNYIEFPAVDMQATKDFFSDAFGWSFEDFGADYTAFSDQGLDGGFYKSEMKSSAFHFIEPSGNELAVWSDLRNKN